MRACQSTTSAFVARRVASSEGSVSWWRPIRHNLRIASDRVATRLAKRQSSMASSSSLDSIIGTRFSRDFTICILPKRHDSEIGIDQRQQKIK